jgi:transposase-like protein
MFYKLEPRPKNENCPHCKSTETFVSLYKESRYCNNCDRTYTQADEIRLKRKKDDAKLHMRVSVY